MYLLTGVRGMTGPMGPQGPRGKVPKKYVTDILN